MLLVKCPFGRNFRADASVGLIFSKADWSPPPTYTSSLNLKWTVNGQILKFCVPSGRGDDASRSRQAWSGAMIRGQTECRRRLKIPSSAASAWNRKRNAEYAASGLPASQLCIQSITHIVTLTKQSSTGTGGAEGWRARCQMRSIFSRGR